MNVCNTQFNPEETYGVGINNDLLSHGGMNVMEVGAYRPLLDRVGWLSLARHLRHPSLLLGTRLVCRDLKQQET